MGKQSYNRLVLGDREPLVRGHKRLIFEHPLHPDRLIKVLQPKLRNFSLYKKPLGAFRAAAMVKRELGQYASLGGNPTPGFLPRFFGFAETDLGPGMIVEKLTDEKGHLARKLGLTAMKTGYTPELRDAIDRFIAEIAASDLVIGDLHLGNLVCAADERGAMRLVLIDGLGAKTLVPTTHFSAALRETTKRRLVRRLIAKLENIDIHVSSSNAGPAASRKARAQAGRAAKTGILAKLSLARQR